MAPKREEVKSEALSHEDILGQCYVAFGQGTAPLRVSRRTVRAFRERYLPRLARKETRRPRAWEKYGPDLLEILRTVGRLAAQEATRRGHMTIEREHFLFAADIVEEAVPQLIGYTPTPWC